MIIAKQEELLNKTVDRINQNSNKLILTNNPYGYEVNINHPLIFKKWISFKNKWEQGKIITEYPLYSDVARRLVFEQQIKKSKYWKKAIEQERQKYYDNYLL